MSLQMMQLTEQINSLKSKVSLLESDKYAMQERFRSSKYELEELKKQVNELANVFERIRELIRMT